MKHSIRVILLIFAALIWTVTSRNAAKVFEAVDTVRKLSFENIEKTKETGKSFDDLAALNKKLM